MTKTSAKRRKLGWSFRPWKDMDPKKLTAKQREKRSARLRNNLQEVNSEMRDIERHVEVYYDLGGYKRRLLKMLARLANADTGDD